jgi:tRNA-2-methylthio-N6-dimethylallyladenosine synthase
MKLHAITLGCQMSAADGAETLASLRGRGWGTADSPEDADAIFLTTCSVRDHAEQRALSLIGRLREWKTRDPKRFLVVAGCVAERLGESLAKRFPHIDLVVGSKKAGSYADLVEQAVAVRNSESPKAIRNPAVPPGGTAVPSGGHAVVQSLTIIRGCSCSCSYCIVPTVRGPELCRPRAEILAEARARIAGGARELILLGQRVNAWRDGGRDLADLLRELDALPGLLRLRFMSPHPALCDGRLLDAMASCPAVCEWLHLPAQSGSDRLLGLMGRGYTRERLLDTARRLRAAVRGVVVSTDIIVGFPSETDADLSETLSLIEELRPATAFCFKYSARQGTPAAKLADDVPASVKEERLAAVNAAVERFTTQALQDMAGKTVEVLAETPTFGRTRTGLKARWKSPAATGELVQLHVSGATRRTLLGDIHDPRTP